MKTLKITLALLSVLLLTISGVQSESVIADNEEPTYESYENYDLMAHTKDKSKLKTNG
ncbi:hypothetical protein [Winogradskyella psychrotolerans]|uniref:hypothetical protein n=1 Tax=Winogradskyella psychrotolerans TaxID=1344585 RepID=UPI001C06F1EE|nr:hypothetical protein [Winogradskyella psychrotolerans]MBU2927819.1 hypothetical protein [Winogradskyella psychrotolerans]